MLMQPYYRCIFGKLQCFYITWFHGIFDDFSFCLVCVQKLFCIKFYVSFFLFAGNLSKDECKCFSARNAEKLPHTELVTVRRAYDGPYVAS